jgi:hypothetical protein
MGFFSKDPIDKFEREVNVAHYKNLKRTAENMKKGTRDECLATIDINNEIIKAEKDVPWWRR